MTKKSRDLIPRGLTYIADNILSRGNIIGSSKEARAAWAKDLKLSKKADTIFFAGCGYQYSAELESLTSLLRNMDKSPLGTEAPVGMAVIQKKAGLDIGGLYSKLSVKKGGSEENVLCDAVAVLKKLGYDPGYLGEDEPCCGGMLHYTGFEDEFRQNAKNVYNLLKEHGVKVIIGIVPSCTYTLQKLILPQIEHYDLRVKHFSEAVLERINKIQLRFPAEARVTYHDPCQLSRYLGIIEEPRRILKAIKGIELVEPDHTNREWSTCCGGGGGFEVVFPELSEILAENRARELAETGAGIIVTHCPGCVLQLRAGLKKMKREDIKVMDLAQVVARAMGV